MSAGSHRQHGTDSLPLERSLSRMDRNTKKTIASAVVVVATPVVTDLAWNVYKGLQPHDLPVPVVFPLPGLAAANSSVSAMTVVERKP
jgi:hypothetical protein